MALLHEKRIIIVAADLPSPKDVIALAQKLQYAQGIWGLKVHTRHLESMGGTALVAAIKEFGHKVFVDRKAHDIPSAVADMIRSYCEIGADMVTVHASGGWDMVSEARRAAEARLAILAVTVLTSIDADTCRRIYKDEPRKAVATLTNEAVPYADGIVCSAEEVGSDEVRKFAPDLLYRVVPGIRPAGADTHEQKRVGTPGQAIRDGATHLVIGRPIYEKGDPKENVARIWDEIREAEQA